MEVEVEDIDGEYDESFHPFSHHGPRMENKRVLEQEEVLFQGSALSQDFKRLKLEKPPQQEHQQMTTVPMEPPPPLNVYNLTYHQNQSAMARERERGRQQHAQWSSHHHTAASEQSPASSQTLLSQQAPASALPSSPLRRNRLSRSLPAPPHPRVSSQNHLLSNSTPVPVAEAECRGAVSGANGAFGAVGRPFQQSQQPLHPPPAHGMGMETHQHHHQHSGYSSKYVSGSRDPRDGWGEEKGWDDRSHAPTVAAATSSRLRYRHGIRIQDDAEPDINYSAVNQTLRQLHLQKRG